MGKWGEGDNRDYSDGEGSGGEYPFILFIGRIALTSSIIYLTFEGFRLLRDLGFDIESVIDESDPD